MATRRATPGSRWTGRSTAATTTVDAAAYTNNQPNATVTTLYTLDAATDKLFIQNPPNNGTQTVPVSVTLNGAPLDFIAGERVRHPSRGERGGEQRGGDRRRLRGADRRRGRPSLYTIDLTTGRGARSSGRSATARAPVQGLALLGEAVPGGLPAIALSADGTQLVRFNTGSPDHDGHRHRRPASTAGDVLVGIDWRPQTGQLFGLGVNDGADNGTLYRHRPADRAYGDRHRHGRPGRSFRRTASDRRAGHGRLRVRLQPDGRSHPRGHRAPG